MSTTDERGGAERRPVRRFRAGMEPMGRAILAEQERDEAEARIAALEADLAAALGREQAIVDCTTQKSGRGRHMIADGKGRQFSAAIQAILDARRGQEGAPSQPTCKHCFAPVNQHDESCERCQGNLDAMGGLGAGGE